MALVDHAKKEINAKIVYYGPERVGKASSLRYVYDRIRPHLRGELKTLSVSNSALVVFDFCPFEQPYFGDYRIRFHMHTFQGRVANLAAWKMTLKGADGLVIVTKASRGGLLAGRQNIVQLRELLGGYGVCLDDIPVVLQLNNPELFGQASIETAARELGLRECSVCPASLLNGKGVLEALAVVSRLVMERITVRGDFPLGRSTSGDAVVAEVSSADILANEAATGGNNENARQEFQKLQQCEALSVVAPTSIGAGQVVVSEGGVRVEESKVIVPLEVTTRDGGQQRLVVTVMVAPG